VRIRQQHRSHNSAIIATGMKLTAVNGSRYSLQILREAVRGAKSATTPIEVLVENRDMVKAYKCFPHLERDASKPDLLEKIIHPLIK